MEWVASRLLERRGQSVRSQVPFSLLEPSNRLATARADHSIYRPSVVAEPGKLGLYFHGQILPKSVIVNRSVVRPQIREAKPDEAGGKSGVLVKEAVAVNKTHVTGFLRRPVCEKGLMSAFRVSGRGCMPGPRSMPATGSGPATASVPAAGSMPAAGSGPATASVPTAGSVTSCRLGCEQH